MKTTKTFLIKTLKHQIQVIKAILAKGVKAFKSYVLKLVDLEAQLEELIMSLPKLRGTEKQTTWANDIRTKVLAVVQNSEDICYASAKKEIIKKEGYASFFMNLELYIQENTAQITESLGLEKAQDYFEALRQSNEEIETMTQALVKKWISKLGNPKMQTGISRIGKLETLDCACTWIMNFKSVTLDWDGYLSIISTLRGDYFAN